MRYLACTLLLFVLWLPMAMAQDSGWFVTAQLGVADYDTTQKEVRRFLL